MSLVDLAKQLQSLVAGALPLIATKLHLLPFLNPQITDEQWPITSVLAVVSSGVTYNLAQRYQKPRLARALALFGFGVAVASVIILLALIGKLVFSDSPDWQDVSARSLFVLLFVGIGLAVGWCSARIL